MEIIKTKMDFFVRFESKLCETKLILPGEKVFVACSGGPDSVALVHLLRALAPKWKLKLGLIHLNHGLRGARAARDARFVKSFALQCKLPFISGSASVKKIKKKEKFSTEEAARSARYDFFVRSAKAHCIPKIALAHTQDDQAETVLMRMLQGTGLQGLCGIRPQLVLKNIKFIRPLLDFSKKELNDFLKINNYEYCEDETNRSTKFFRNRLRKNLLPVLKRYNPRVVEALSRIPAAVREEQEVLRRVEHAVWKKVYRAKRLRTVYLNRPLFLGLPSALQFRLLERGLRQLDLKSGLGAEAWARLRPEFSHKRVRHSLARDIDFILTPSKLILYKKSCLQ